MKFNIGGLPVNFDLVKFLKENSNSETIGVIGDFIVKILYNNEKVREAIVNVLLYSDEGKYFLKKLSEEEK